ncbi:MAG: DUF4394 domain-containing protein [Fimbriimonas sp.]
MKRELFFLAVLGFAIPLAGCGGSGNDDNNNNPPAGAPFIGFRNNQLVRGDVNNPQDATSEEISGIPDGVDIIGLDDRPANGDLIALGSDNRLYTIDLGASSATVIGATAFEPGVTGNAVGFDFNPVVDRLRIIGDDGQNLRVNPNNGVLAATDTSISDVNADIVAVAYTNNFAGATTTTLYGIDANSDSLVRVGGENGTPSPNGGVTTTVGALGINVGADASFDIATSGEAYLASGGTIYRINLTSGAATPIGQMDAGLDAFTVVP